MRPDTQDHPRRRSWPRRRRFAFGAAVALVVSYSALAQDEELPPASTEEEIIEQILLLRQQIDSLLEALPPTMREEVEKRWRARQQAELPVAESPASLEPLEPTAQTRVTPAPLSPATSPQPRATCGTLGPLDTNEDGLLSGGDRYWRYLRLWFDNGDSTPEESEIESLFDLGIRQIDVKLSFYKDSDEAIGDIDVDDLVRLHLHRNGRSSTRTGVLTVEAGRLARTDELWLTDSAGTRLTQVQPLASELVFESADGTRHPLSCP